MNRKTFALVCLLGLVLILAGPASAQQPTGLTVYLYRQGQAVPVARPGVLSGDPQTDAEALLAALVGGPTPEEQAAGLTSPLPPDTELGQVAVLGDEVTVDLRLPLDFLRYELDAYRSDYIVEQVVKTMHVLGLHRVHVRTEDKGGAWVPVSAFVPRSPAVTPAVPPNDDPLPARPGPAPDGGRQPLGALSGKTVWLSAGHGWYWSDTLDRWTTQRGNNHGLVEDFSNAEAVNYYLARYLWNAGADVWLVRERAMNQNQVVVDNDDGAPGYVETGTWTTSGSPGYNDGTYRYAATAETLSATATWTPDLPEAGWYAVWVWYRHGGNRPIDARYEVHHAGGVAVVSISQEVHGLTWRYLGEYYFEAGTAGHVALLNESDDPGQAIIADAVRFGGGLGSIDPGNGPSGEPRWEEAAKYWVQFQGAPPEIYDSDVTARPLYAEWESAKGYPGEAENAVYISWHTNAGGGTGSESYIHDTEPTTGSVELQDWVHPELIGDLKAAWDPDWVNRGQKTADFGELRELSTIPGVLLEVAFHDTEEPGDADDLREPLFRQIAARAVFQGIVKYHAERAGTPVHLLPEPPERLVVRNTAPGKVTLTWAPPPCCDGVVGDAATAYKVYHSDGGRAFDDGIVALTPTLTLTGLAPGTLHFFHVTALNEGGESFPTPVVAARTPAAGQAPVSLIVDGFDRLDQEAMIPQWETPFLGTAQRMFLERMNRYDYAVEHGGALAACSQAFDGTVNEAVAAGDVVLDGYQAVDWFVGEDSVADTAVANEAFSDAERALLATYLDGGGRLLVSGSEIGYDLVDNGLDPTFYQEYLHADYLGDSAGTYGFAGTLDGPFAGLNGSFDDGTQGTYDVGYADRVASAFGSTLALAYTGGSADGAAVAYTGDSRVVYLAFPLETVTDPAMRTALFCAATKYLLLSEGPDVDLYPNRSAVVYPGETVVYSHTLANLSRLPDTFHVTHASDREWAITHTTPITLESGLATTLLVSVAVPAGVPSGTADVTVLTATSQADPAVYAVVTDTTLVIHQPLPVTPRLINPGFEQGLDQSAWLVSASGEGQVFVQRDDLPAYVEPHSGDWLAWVGGRTPGLTTATALTQVVALPAGEPAVTLTLVWLAHAGVPAPTISDTLAVGVYDLGGTLQTTLLTITALPPAAVWQVATFDLGAWAGQTVQLALRTVTSDTAFFVDDVNLTTTGPPGPDEFRALWVDAFHDGIKSPQQVDELIETAQAGNFNTLVIQVRRRGDTYYPSDLDPWAPDADPGFDALAYLVEQAHAAGIGIHAWATTLAIWGGDAAPDAPDHTFNAHGPSATGRDYWLMTSYAGEDKPGDELYYLDPGHPDAVEYTVAIYAELAANYDLDGLHLDRIRYPEPHGAYCQDQEWWYCQDWGYNPTSVARFQAQTGRSDVPLPLDEEWTQWRRDQVTALVRRVYLTVTAIDPRLRVSAALSTIGDPPIGVYGWQTRSPYRQQLQDWRGWLEEGLLDLALPMTYRDEVSATDQFDGWIAWQKDHQYGRGTVVGTGLFVNAMADSMDQWRRVRQPSGLENRALGMSGYSYALPSDEGASRRTFVNVAVTEVFTRPALIPPISWKDTPSQGHLMGVLTATQPCTRSLDNQVLALTGPQSRALRTDGSGWFGAVDLPSGEYYLSVTGLPPGVALSLPLSVTVGAVTEQEVALPGCPLTWDVYLPQILKQASP